MTDTEEAQLREAIRLLDRINDDPLHPANDARHPEHCASVLAYQKLELWVSSQQELLSKQRLNDGYLRLDY